MNTRSKCRKHQHDAVEPPPPPLARLKRKVQQKGATEPATKATTRQSRRIKARASSKAPELSPPCPTKEASPKPSSPPSTGSSKKFMSKMMKSPPVKVLQSIFRKPNETTKKSLSWMDVVVHDKTGGTPTNSSGEKDSDSKEEGGDETPPEQIDTNLEPPGEVEPEKEPATSNVNVHEPEKEPATINLNLLHKLEKEPATININLQGNHNISVDESAIESDLSVRDISMDDTASNAGSSRVSGEGLVDNFDLMNIIDPHPHRPTEGHEVVIPSALNREGHEQFDKAVKHRKKVKNRRAYGAPRSFGDIKGYNVRRKLRLVSDHLWKLFDMTRPPATIKSCPTAHWPQFAPIIILADQIIDPPTSGGQWPDPSECHDKSRLIVGFPDERALTLFQDLLGKAHDADWKSNNVIQIEYVDTKEDLDRVWRRTLQSNAVEAVSPSVRVSRLVNTPSAVQYNNSDSD